MGFLSGVNWLGIFVVVISIGLFVWIYRHAQKMPKSRQILWFIVFGILAVPGASFIFYYLHLVDPPTWYYQFRSIRGVEFVLTFIGVAGGFSAALLPRVVRSLPLAGVIMLTLVPHLKPFLGPLDDEEFKEQWSGGICLQSTGSTCGPASTCTILKSFGIEAKEAKEADLAREAYSYGSGTESWYLARAIRNRGFQAVFRRGEGLDDSIQFPAVVGVLLSGGAGHFIPILGKEGDSYVLGDPLRKKEMRTREELEQSYEFTGFYLEITR